MNTKLSLLLFIPAVATAAPTVPSVVTIPPVSQQVSNVLNFNQLAKQCAPGVHHNTLQAIARVESGFNPYAIGVVKGALKKQPTTYAEAVAAAKSLHAQGKNFSMGLVQVNKKNLAHYGLSYETVFDPCKNIAAAAKILTDCFSRAEGGRMTQSALQKSFSCYYSGNFRFGFTRDFGGQPSYVQKVVNSAALNSDNTTLRVPAIDSRSSIITPSRAPKAKSNPTPYLQPAVATYNASNQNEVTTEQPAKAERIYPGWDVFREF